MALTHLLSLTDQALNQFVLGIGQPEFRSRQLRNWLFSNLEIDFQKMQNLPKAMQNSLQETATCSVLSLKAEQISEDGTTKWAFETQDKNVFESVLIPSENRRSLCVSSQVGCAMGCKFCRTASMGFIRNLSLGEILEQVHFANRHLKQHDGSRISNVIFMGMGEPLHNLEAVALACEILNSEDGFGISRNKITVSTSGVVPKILEWARRASQFKLAISLNGSNNLMRDSLMPINRRWPLEVLLETADEYIRLTGQRLTFEYILIKDITATPEAAHELKQIAAHRNCKLNLIPLNPGSFPGRSELAAPSESEIEEFENILNTGGFQVLRRKPRGRDIFAACGQLAIQQKEVA